MKNSLKNLQTLLVTIELVTAVIFGTVLTSLPKAQAQDGPTMTIEPNIYEAHQLGETFNVTVNLYNLKATDKAVALQFRIPYNGSVLKALDVTEGSLLQQFPNTADPPYTFMTDFIEDDPIYGPNVLVGILVIPNATGQWTNFPYGNGTLATITFKAIYRPIAPDTLTCPLNLVSTMILSEDAEIDHTTVGATYEALPIPTPSINIEPATYTASLIGEVFQANVTINNLDIDWGLIAAQFRVQYNGSVLKALDVTEGSLLQQFPNTADPPYTFMTDFIEDDPIYGPNVLVGILVIPNATGQWTNFPYGNGTLATITFKAISQTAEPQPPDSSDLTLTNVLLLNDTSEIPYTLTNGYFETAPLQFSYGPSTLRTDQAVNFEAPQSTSPANYNWDFGDGTNSTVTEPTTAHIYTIPGEYTVNLTCTSNGLVSTTATETINVLLNNIPTIDVTGDVGKTHFRGETAEFGVLVSNLGEAVNATRIEALLYHDDILVANLTNSVKTVATGLYMIPYDIPVYAETGTYRMIINAEYYNAKGNTMTSFQISPTLTNWGNSIAKITEIDNGIATIQDGLDTINVNLTTIDAKITAVQGNVAIVDSKIGTLQTNLNTINTTITDIKGNTATLSTTLGEVKVDVTNLGARSFDGTQITTTVMLLAVSIISAIAVILALVFITFVRKK